MPLLVYPPSHFQIQAHCSDLPPQVTMSTSFCRISSEKEECQQTRQCFESSSAKESLFASIRVGANPKWPTRQMPEQCSVGQEYSQRAFEQDGTSGVMREEALQGYYRAVPLLSLMAHQGHCE